MRSRNRLWRWIDVAMWAQQANPDEVHDALVLAAINALLDLRAVRHHIPDEVKRLARGVQMEWAV